MGSVVAPTVEISFSLLKSCCKRNIHCLFVYAELRKWLQTLTQPKIWSYRDPGHPTMHHVVFNCKKKSGCGRAHAPCTPNKRQKGCLHECVFLNFHGKLMPGPHSSETQVQTSATRIEQMDDSRLAPLHNNMQRSRNIVRFWAIASDGSHGLLLYRISSVHWRASQLFLACKSKN
ncbi:hypothetical protein BC940DRAFT_72448 [Gongronella butleri]|nr:hypothetical protein BC940DRAFT_72448 [Gongronella butleri]